MTYEQVNGLQDDINFYISDNQEAEFEENELLYEEFDSLMTAALKEDNRYLQPHYIYSSDYI